MSSQEKETTQEQNVTKETGKEIAKETTKDKTAKSSRKESIFSLIETLGVYCLYAGLAALVAGYFWKFGFTFIKPSREQILELFVFAARIGLIFALVFGLPIWLAKQQNDKH
jgi:hypothetical protein